MFLMPPHTLHSPQRPEAGSLCLVVERRRPQGETDAFHGTAPDAARWSSATSCSCKHRRGSAAGVQGFYATSDAERRCPQCGEIHPGRDFQSWHRVFAQSQALRSSDGAGEG